MSLNTMDPLSAHEAGRELPNGRVGHTEEMRASMMLLFLAGAMMLLLVGLVIGTVTH